MLLFSKLHCQKVLVQLSFHIRSRPPAAGRQSRPDSGLGLERFQRENLETHLSCSLPARQRHANSHSRSHVGTSERNFCFRSTQLVFALFCIRLIAPNVLPKGSSQLLNANLRFALRSSHQHFHKLSIIAIDRMIISLVMISCCTLCTRRASSFSLLLTQKVLKGP